MSHVQVADVWSFLRKRTDIASLLREAVGRSVLGGAFEKPSDSAVLTGQAALWQLLLFLKVCLDLQRIYLQSPQPTERYLLHPSTLVLVLLHVLRTKERLPTDIVIVRRQLQGLIVQCLQSGCRALQIWRQKQLWQPADDDTKVINKLKDAIRAAFTATQVTFFHGFIITELCIRVLNEITSENSASEQVCEHERRIGSVNLPDISIGLHVDSTVINQAREATDCLTAECQGRFRSYWVLYDTWWAVIAWSLELAMQKKKEPGLSQLLTQRSAALLTTLSRFEDCPESLHMAGTLAAEVYPVCAGTTCDCFDNPAKAQASHVSPPIQRFFTQLRDDFREVPELEQYFEAIHLFLEQRKSTIIDSGNAITDISESLRRMVRDWVAQSSINQRENACYVLNCPLQHPVSFELLKSKLPNFEFTDQGLIELNISCPRCFSETGRARRNNDVRVTSARLIAPIYDISSLLENSRRYADEATKQASNWTQEDLSSLSEMENSESPSKISRPPTAHTSNEQIDSHTPSSFVTAATLSSEHVAVPSTEKAGHSQSSRFFRDPAFRFTKSSSSSGVTPPPNHTMSADAQHVLIWTTSGLMIYDRTANDVTPNLTKRIKHVRHAAAGSKLLALYIKENEMCVLHSLEDAEEPVVTLNMAKLGGRVTAMAVSKDDAKVAVAYYKTSDCVGVRVFESERDWDYRSFSWPEKLAPDDDGPLVAYSSDSRDMAVAWRAKSKQGGKAKLAAVRDKESRGPQELPMPEGEPSWMDYGISAPAIHGASGQIFLGAANGKTFPYIVQNTLRENPVKLAAKFTGSSCRIQCAVAQPGQTPRFAFVDCESKLYFTKPNEQSKKSEWCSTHLKIKQLEERGQRLNIRDHMHRVSISCSSSTTFLFWLSTTKSTLYGHIVTIEHVKSQEPKYRRFELPDTSKN